MAQKAVAADADADFRPIFTDKDGINRPDRILFLVPAIAEGAEIVFSYQNAGRLSHLGDVERPSMPKAIRRQIIDGPRSAVPDQILVYLGLGVIAGMEAVGHGLGGEHEHVFGKIVIQRGLELGIGKRAPGFEVSDQPPGMNAAVRARTGNEVGFLSEDAGELFLEDFLERLASALALPAVVTSALEGDDELNGSHTSSSLRDAKRRSNLCLSVRLLRCARN